MVVMPVVPVANTFCTWIGSGTTAAAGSEATENVMVTSSPPAVKTWIVAVVAAMPHRSNEVALRGSDTESLGVMTNACGAGSMKLADNSRAPLLSNLNYLTMVLCPLNRLCPRWLRLFVPKEKEPPYEVKHIANERCPDGWINSKTSLARTAAGMDEEPAAGVLGKRVVDIAKGEARDDTPPALETAKRPHVVDAERGTAAPGAARDERISMSVEVDASMECLSVPMRAGFTHNFTGIG